MVCVWRGSNERVARHRQVDASKHAGKVCVVKEEWRVLLGVSPPSPHRPRWSIPCGSLLTGGVRVACASVRRSCEDVLYLRE